MKWLWATLELGQLDDSASVTLWHAWYDVLDLSLVLLRLWANVWFTLTCLLPWSKRCRDFYMMPIVDGNNNAWCYWNWKLRCLPCCSVKLGTKAFVACFYAVFFLFPFCLGAMKVARNRVPGQWHLCFWGFVMYRLVTPWKFCCFAVVCCFYGVETLQLREWRWRQTVTREVSSWNATGHTFFLIYCLVACHAVCAVYAKFVALNWCTCLWSKLRSKRVPFSNKSVRLVSCRLIGLRFWLVMKAWFSIADILE